MNTLTGTFTKLFNAGPAGKVALAVLAVVALLLAPTVVHLVAFALKLAVVALFVGALAFGGYVVYRAVQKTSA